VIQVIFNPASGASRRRGVLSELAASLRAAGQTAELRPTAGPGDARRFAAEAPDDARAVIAVGGDGTVREVAAGLAARASAGRPTPPLGVLPVGNENLFAAGLGFTADPAALAAAVAGGRTAPLDLGRATWPGMAAGESEPFAVVAGVGFDAEMLARLARMRRQRPGGHMSRLDYLPAAWRTAGSYRWPAMRVVADGAEVMPDAGIVLVANLPGYALGLRLCHSARPDDGLLDLAAFPCRHLGDLSVHAAATILGSLLNRPIPSPGAVRLRARRVEVSPAFPHSQREPIPVELDGEPLGRLSAVFECVPGAVRVVSNFANPS
jgi:diacylglycerol kinase family enzyme